MVSSPTIKYDRVDEADADDSERERLNMEISDSDELPVARKARFLEREQWRPYVPEQWRPLMYGLGAGALGVLLLVVGFLVGRGNSIISTQPLQPIKTPSSQNPILESLSHLPKIDLWEDYGLNYTADSLYPEPLGKKICIINADTRVWEPHTGLRNQSQNAWGWMHHFLYAKMHGYDYKFLQIDPMKDRENYWVKVEGIRRMTLDQNDYKFIVFTDADIIFPDLRLPLEPLLSHWNITPEIAIASTGERPQDDKDKVVPGRGRWDIHGKPEFNTGFVITQKTPVSEDILNAWMDCPTGKRYPKCKKYGRAHAHEQSALSSFIRYDPAWPGRFLEIPFADANSPGGRYIGHHWFAKDHLARIVKDSILNRIMPGVLDLVTEMWPETGMDLRAGSSLSLNTSAT